MKNSEEDLIMGIKVSAAVIGCTFLIEMYHHYVVPKLNKIKPSEKQAVLILIPFIIFLVFFGIYYFKLNLFT